MQRLILGSTSPFRREILQKLRLPFEVDAPHVDEEALDGETPEALVARLAEAKARDVASRHANALVIGSDQVACIDGMILGKPGGRDNAIKQLSAASGRSVVFYTALCLLNSGTDDCQLEVEPFTVHFRQLSRDQIVRYLDIEQPFNCAGSFKSEGYGITLFSALQGHDPNTLVGLPLIRLIDMLMREGVELP